MLSSHGRGNLSAQRTLYSPASDTFATTLAALENHASDATGDEVTTWAKHPSAASGLNSGSPSSGRCCNGSGSLEAIYTHTADPATVDYRVTGYFIVQTYTSGNNFGVMARADASANTCYVADCVPSASANAFSVRLRKIVGGSATTLGTYTPGVDPAVGETVKIILSVSNDEKVVYVQMPSESSFHRRITSGDNSITASGYAGLRALRCSSSQGFHCTYWKLERNGPQLATGSGVVGTTDPVQSPALLWSPDYTSTGDSVGQNNGGTAWYREQEPDVLGVRQTTRAQIVAQASLPGQGQTYTPSGNGLRIELRPYHTGSDFTVTATATATSSGTSLTMSTGDVAKLADKEFLLNQRTNEMLRVNGTPSGTTVPVLRAQHSTGQAVNIGDTFLVSTGDINDSGSSTNGYATNRCEVYDRFPAGGGSTPPANWPDPVGSVRWYGYSVLFASPFTFDSSKWFTFTQFKGQFGGSPPRAMEIRGTDHIYWAGTRTGRDLGQITLDTWTRLVIGVRWETDGVNGWSMVYRDGVLKVPKTYEATMDTYNGGADPIYLKEGIYRTSGWTSTHVLYYGPIKVGNTIADVWSP